MSSLGYKDWFCSVISNIFYITANVVQLISQCRHIINTNFSYFLNIEILSNLMERIFIKLFFTSIIFSSILIRIGQPKVDFKLFGNILKHKNISIKLCCKICKWQLLIKKKSAYWFSLRSFVSRCMILWMYHTEVWIKLNRFLWNIIFLLILLLSYYITDQAEVDAYLCKQYMLLKMH